MITSYSKLLFLVIPYCVFQWDLVCDKKWMMSFAQTSYMLGFLLGSLFLSELSDTFGRRTVLLWSVLLFNVTTVATAFSVNYTMFIIMRLLIAVFGSGMYLCNFVNGKFILDHQHNNIH